MNPPGICSECLKKKAIEQNTRLIATYCQHTKTGALLLPMMNKMRWMLIYPIEPIEFANYINDLVGRSLISLDEVEMVH